MLVLLSSLTMQAQHWTAPSESEYQTSTPVYVQVKINGSASTAVEVAAFIDGVCRGAATEATINTNAGNLYTLRVWGNTDEVNKKQISFKVFDRNSGIVFACTKQTTFTGETVSEVPFVLNIDKPTGVEITNPINIVAKFPCEKDLSDEIEFTYEGMDDTGAPIEYEPLGESTIETTLNYTWTAVTPNGAFNAFTIDNNNILTATQTTLLPGSVENTGEEAMLTIGVTDYASLCSGNTVIIIDEEVTPVTGIKCSMSTVKINKNESLYDIEELNNAITIEPADASNKNYTFEPANPEDTDAFKGGVALKGGVYDVKIVSEYDPEIYTTITVEVNAPVEYLRVSQQTFHAAIEDNILDIITPYVVVGPDDATDKGFHLEIPNEASDAIVENVACIAGKYTIYVVSDDNPEIKSEVTVVITELIAPESIEVEINTNAYDVLRPQIIIRPENDEGESYTITPADDATADAIVNEYATKNGTYKLLVTSVLNPNVSVEVTVIVSTPVNITFPGELTISKYKDTEFQLTVTGDNFDPSLVELEFKSNNMPEGFGVPTYTSADDGQGKIWNIRGTGTGSAELRVLYNGAYMPREGEAVCYIETPAEISFNNNGWDWIYAPTTINLKNNEGNYIEQMNIDENNRVIEIRSQTALLYNDPTFGIFGGIELLNPGEGMYKIKATYEDASNCIFTSAKPSWERNQSKMLQPGYTWIGYTNEWDMTLEELNTVMNGPSEGDQIIGKTGFAEYSDGAWVGVDFILEAGKGYLYYNTADYETTFSFDYTPDFSNQAYSLSRKKAKSTKNSVWKYDASQFADNMAIVAQIAGLENPEDYTIGAFVDDECRGMGKVVKDGKMMINVAGKAGETVTFRLHNEYTGEYVDIDSKVNYAQKLGSLKAPAVFEGGGLTSISTVEIEESDETTYYDLSGRIVEGEIPSGVYIVKTVKNGKVVVRKVVKK
ncbi:MAG: hypothetical protein E7089_04205 [Bacteroidales bacterium]|nr:hypothetical protein [Bacteroidales bacterium]